MGGRPPRLGRRRADLIEKPPALALAREPEVTTPTAPDTSVAGRVAQLQQAVGNRGMGQVVARRPAAKQTGIRSDQAINRFARKAVGFFRRNPDLPLKYFALYLGAAVNEELAAVGVTAVHARISEGGMGAAAEFVAGDWEMLLNPSEFTHRPEVEKLGDLTPEEAAIIAMTVYHEARHAEQHFRIARLLAGQHKELSFEMEEHAAGEAAGAPLDPRKASGRELGEAQEWTTNEIGDDATYREAVTSWLGDLRKAARLARDVDAEHAGEVRDRLGRLIHGWSKPGGAEDYIRSHLTSAKARKASLVIKDITRITAGFDRVEAAFKQLHETAQPADFKPLAEALADLYRAVNTAYRDQPVEHDAWGTGDAVFEAVSKAFAGAR